MSLDFLAELVSVTSEAMKSLNKSSSTGTSEKIQLFNAGSPFLSPRSFQSVSDKSEHRHEPVPKDIMSKNSKPRSDLTNSSNENVIHTHTATAENAVDWVGLEMVDRIADIIPSETVNGSESKTHLPNRYIENVNNSNISNNQKVSISKKHVREIISQKEDIPIDIPCSSHSKASSKDSDSFSEQKDHSFPATSKSKRKFFVERHDSANINNNRVIGGEAETESVHSFSTHDDQPEIIDVQERVVAITSGLSKSSDDSMNDMQNKVEEACESGRSSRGISYKTRSGENEARHGLKQGALKKGFVDPTKTGLFSDVYISQFGLTDRQRGLKEALAKRSDSNKPKKKLVQPQIIQRKCLNDAETDRPAANKQSSSVPAISSAADPVITAAAAATAAVAAAQPFLKTQHELETRMQQLLTQLTELQQKQNGTNADEKSSGSDNRILDLERQVAGISERRFEHLEKLQQQQMQMQAQLLYMSQARNNNNRGYLTDVRTSPSRQPQNSRIPQAVADRPGRSSRKADLISYNPTAQNQPTYNHSTHKQPIFNPATLSQHHNYLSEVRELQGSHLDTPAPRDRVPKPIPYTLPKEPQKSLGFLEELLAGKDSTFSVKGDYSSPSRLTSDW